MQITEFRQKYPQYDDMSDIELTRSLHAKNYSDMDYDVFADRFGFVAPEGIGFVESVKEEFTRPAHGFQYIPIGGGMVATQENLVYLDAAHRLRQKDYDYNKPIREEPTAVPGVISARPLKIYSSREKDQKMIEGLILRTQEQQERGYTYGGKVAKGVLNLPTWMAEFAMTGGLASLGSGAARTAGTKLIGQWAKTKAGSVALRTAGWTGGAITRATLGLTPRITERALGRQVNVQILGAEKEGWATSFAKAWGDITIEAASETAGEAITGIPVKLLKKTRFGSKFLKALKSGWMKATNGTAASFAKKVAAKGGYSNIIGEYGEERLGTLLRALTAVEDFGVGKDAGVIERLMAAVKQDLDPQNIAVEFTVLGVVPGAQVMLGVAEQLRTKRVSKLIPGGIDNLIYAEASSISDAVAKHADMPGVNIIAEHLVRRYGPKKGSTFYDRKIERLADSGKKISNYWNEQTNKDWEAPNPDITEAKWKNKPISRTVSAASSGLTSAGTVVGTKFFTEDVDPELISLASSEANIIYNRFVSEGVSDNVATKFAQITGAWAYTTQEIPFDKLLGSNKTSILTTLKKEGWEGTQEIAETIGRNLLKHFGYKYTRPQNIPTTVKAMYDHAMDSWLDALMGGIGSAGTTQTAIEYPTIEQLTGKKREDIVPRTADQAIGAKYGYTPKQVDSRLQQAAFRYGELKRSDPNKRSLQETKDLAFFEENRTDIKAILVRDIVSEAKKARDKSNLPWRSAPPPIRAQMSTTSLKALAQKLKEYAGLSDAKFSRFAYTTTDKLSMEDMNKKQLINFVSALEESHGTYGELAGNEYGKIVLAYLDEKPMETVWGEAKLSIKKLENKKKTDAEIKRTTIGTRIGKSWQWTKSFTAGIKNTPIFHLAKILDGGEIGIFSNILSKGIEHGRRKAAQHKRLVIEAVMKRLEERGVVDKDLALMGQSVNPRLKSLQWIGKTITDDKIWTTEILKVKITGKLGGESKTRTYSMTMAELIDIYLISNQKDGMRHLKSGGLVINKTRTGGLSKLQIEALQRKVMDDPKAEAVINTILEVGKLWKESINGVSRKLHKIDLATIEDWWGLEVYEPSKRKPLSKIGLAEVKEAEAAELEITDLKIGRGPELNLVKDPGILHDRTKSKLPLVVRDVFNRFNNFENIIAEYYGMARPTETARTLINDPAIVAALNEKGYDKERKAIAEIHKRAEIAPESAGEFTAWLTKHLPLLYRAVLIFNPRVIAAQATSAFSYGAYVSRKYIPTAFEGGFNFIEWKETLELSDIAWDRFYMGRSSLEMGELAQTDAVLRMWTGGKASDLNKAGWTIKTADLTALTVGMKIAQAEYQTLKKEGKLTGFSEEWWLNKKAEELPDADIELWRKVKEREKTITVEDPLTEEEQTERNDVKIWQEIVSERAEYLWQRTQPSWDKWNRSLLTSERGAKQLFLLFRSFHEKSLTIFNEAMLDLRNSPHRTADYERFIRRSTSVVTGYVVNAFIKAVIIKTMAIPATMYVGGKIWPPDEKEWTKLFQDMVMSWFAAFPILGKVTKTFISRIYDVAKGIKPSYAYEPLDSLPIGVLNDLFKVPEDIADGMGHSLAGEHDEATEAYLRGVKRAAIAVGLLSGLPAYEVKRIFTPEKEPKGKKTKW